MCFTNKSSRDWWSVILSNQIKKLEIPIEKEVDKDPRECWITSIETRLWRTLGEDRYSKLLIMIEDACPELKQSSCKITKDFPVPTNKDYHVVVFRANLDWARAAIGNRGMVQTHVGFFHLKRRTIKYKDEVTKELTKKRKFLGPIITGKTSIHEQQVIDSLDNLEIEATNDSTENYT